MGQAVYLRGPGGYLPVLDACDNVAKPKSCACHVVANFSNFVALSLSRRISVASLRQQTDYKLKIEICCDSSVGRYFCYFTGSIASSGSASDLPSSNSNLASFVEQYMHFKIQQYRRVT